MSANTHLMTWVTRDTKERFAALAHQQNTTDSAFLKRMVEASIRTVNVVEAIPKPMEPIAASGRLSVRLRSDDFLLLRERATSRGLPTGTYVTYLIRSHLRCLAPLPDNELAALKRAIAEISAIGRNLNQIAWAVNLGGPTAGWSPG